MRVANIHTLPNEIIKLITHYSISGLNRVLSASCRLVCKLFYVFIRPVRMRYVTLNLVSIAHKNIIAILYAYRYNPGLVKRVANLYKYKHCLTEYAEIQQKISEQWGT
ncbi:hypothetical protein F-E9_489 [Faustovirus]|nr:hypothetical protein F-E9_489 [Faustovirus]